MKTQKLRFMIFGIAAAVMAAGLTGCPIREFVDQEYTEVREFAPGGQLNVQSIIGDVTVSAWNQNSVSITYRKKVSVFYRWFGPAPDPDIYFDQMAVVIETSANTPGLTVRDVMPVTVDRPYSPSIELDIKMPARAILNVGQDVGDVTITGIHGTLVAQVNVGDLTIDHPLPLAGESIASAVQIGDTKLYLPEGSAFDAEAITRVGRITAGEFWGINVVNDGLGAQAAGRVNGGGANVNLDTDIGDIAFLRE
ncbi:MAG TPA: hypothetical protein PKO36_13480 [Candidatus Hydrogenedentes bacterium]|nr:hypothetical protein [Candidatus Hydrogenedentota bacterium]